MMLLPGGRVLNTESEMKDAVGKVCVDLLVHHLRSIWMTCILFSIVGVSPCRETEWQHVQQVPPGVAARLCLMCVCR